MGEANIANRSLARNSLNLSFLEEVVQCSRVVPSGLDLASMPDFFYDHVKLSLQTITLQNAVASPNKRLYDKWQKNKRKVPV